VLGIAEAGDHMAFARQIEVAAAHGFGGRAARSSRSLAPKALRPR
jgi:UTP:GlnB (protein PII) uridylyltransferase